MLNKTILIAILMCCITYFITALLTNNDRYSFVKNDNAYILLDKNSGNTWGWKYNCDEHGGCWIKMRTIDPQH